MVPSVISAKGAWYHLPSAAIPKALIAALQVMVLYYIMLAAILANRRNAICHSPPFGNR